MTAERRLLLALVAVGLLGWTVAGKPGLPDFDNPSPAVDDRAATKVSARTRETVEPVADLLGDASKSERARLAALWHAFSIDIADDKSPLKTAGDLRQLQAMAGPLYFHGDRAGPRGIGDALDEVIKKAIGDDDAALDNDRRDKAAEIFEAISQAAGG